MGKRQLTKDERISQAKQKHGDKYGYSLWPQIVTANMKVKTICPEHGVFVQKVAEHCVGGRGCATCAGTKRLTKHQRIKQSKNVHGDKYDYSLWPEDITALSLVKTVCQKHGIFSQKLKDHIHNGAGCPKCHCNYISTKQRIEDAKSAHGDKYDYSLWPDEHNNKTPYPIICPEHGVFNQTIHNHIALQHGCPSCAAYGFNDSKQATLYFLRSEHGFIKIGISNNPDARLAKLKHKTPFDFEVLARFEYEKGREVRDIEKLLHDMYKHSGLSGFDGATEWRIVPTLSLLDIPELFGFRRV